MTVHVNELYTHSITFQVLATRFHDDGCVRVMAVFDCFSIFAMEMKDANKCRSVRVRKFEYSFILFHHFQLAGLRAELAQLANTAFSLRALSSMSAE